MIKKSIITEARKKSRIKMFIYFLVLIFLFLIVKVFYGYLIFQPNKYGVAYNEERQKLGIETMPNTFRFSKSSFNTFYYYYKSNRIYSVEFVPNVQINSGLFKIKIDVDENGEGIVREYRYFKHNNDTICKIYNYYEHR